MADFSWLHEGISLLGVGTVFGALVSAAFTRRLARSDEERKYLGQALAELLKIREYLCATKYIKRHFEIAWGHALPAQGAAYLQLSLPWMLSTDWAASRKCYNDALAALAEFRPVLAYGLGGKDSIVLFLERLAVATMQQPDKLAEVWAWFDDQITQKGLPALAEASLVVARKHSRWGEWRNTLRTTRLALLEQDERTSQLDQSLIDKLKQTPYEKPPDISNATPAQTEPKVKHRKEAVTGSS